MVPSVMIHRCPGGGLAHRLRFSGNSCLLHLLGLHVQMSHICNEFGAGSARISCHKSRLAEGLKRQALPAAPPPAAAAAERPSGSLHRTALAHHTAAPSTKSMAISSQGSCP